MCTNILKEKYDIKHLWYFTHIDNLESILTEGILSRKTCIEKGLLFKDISDPDIQKRRKPYQHFTPLFFAPCPPMAYRSMSEYKDEIIAIGVTTDIILSEKYLFSDANISCTDNCIFMVDSDLKYLDMDLIKCTPTPMSNPTSVLNHMTNIERCKRGAELLVLNKVPPSYIASISVSERSDKAYNRVDEILKQLGQRIPIHRNLVSDGVKLI